jgi:hypothetical protein
VCCAKPAIQQQQCFNFEESRRGSFMSMENEKRTTNQADEKQVANTQAPGKTDQATPEGGRRDPIHPDDIGAEGEYLGNDTQQPPNRNKRRVAVEFHLAPNAS